MLTNAVLSKFWRDVIRAAAASRTEGRKKDIQLIIAALLRQPILPPLEARLAIELEDFVAGDPDRLAKNFKKPVVSRSLSSSSSSSTSSPSSSDDDEPPHSSTRLPPASAPVVPRPPAERPALTPPLPPQQEDVLLQRFLGLFCFLSSKTLQF